MKNLLIILLLIFAGFCNSFAQYSFEVLVSSPVSERIIDLMEEESGSFLAVGYEGRTNPQEESFVGLIIRISKQGDAVVNRYFNADTGYIFRKIVKSYDNQYYVFGSSVKYPQDQNHNLLILKLDTSLNIIWKKTYDFDERWHYPMKILPTKDSGFHLISQVSMDYGNYSIICRLSKNCDVIRSEIIDELGQCSISDAIYSSDSSQLYLFGVGFGFVYGSRVVYDTNYNYLHMNLLPDYAMRNMTAKWISETSILFAANYPNFDPGPQHDDIGISETDTSFSNMNINRFGAIDTIDYTADVITFDFRSPDSIFLLGTHNISFSSWPQDVSWISLRQLNRDLEPRSELFIGGDAYYRSFTILSTSDGGCLIFAKRYDYQVQNEDDDIYILKLAKEDIITSELNDELEDSSNILIYPNPGNILNIRNQFNDASIYIFSTHGELVKHQKLNVGNNIIQTCDMISGVYFYKIVSDSHCDISGKWIKKIM